MLHFKSYLHSTDTTRPKALEHRIKWSLILDFVKYSFQGWAGKAIFNIYIGKTFAEKNQSKV